MSSVIEFNGINTYDLDIQPHGVYLTVHSDAGSHQIRVNCSTITKTSTSEPKVVTTNTLNTKVKSKPVQPSDKPASYWKARFAKKLSDKDVIEVRALWPQVYEEYRTSQAAARFLAELYNCSPGTIIGIVKNQSRSNVTAYSVSKEDKKAS